MHPVLLRLSVGIVRTNAALRKLDGQLLAGTSVADVVAIGDVRNQEVGTVLLDDRHAEGARTDKSFASVRPNAVEVQVTIGKAKTSIR